MKRVCFAVPAVLAGLLHCAGHATETNVPAGADDTDAGGSALLAASEPDGGTVGVLDDGASFVTSAGDSCTATDAPDSLGLDTNCDGADGVVGKDVYVSVDTGQDTNPGTPTAPFATISAAVAAAAARGGSVLVLQSSGTYPVTELSTAGNWSVYGGYPTGFLGAPNRQTTVLSTPDTGLLVDTASSAKLAHLTVQGGLPSKPSQPSSYALRTSIAKLLLDDVILQSGDALSLPQAAQGGGGADGVNSIGPLVCKGVTQPSYTSGACCGASSEGHAVGTYNSGSPGDSYRANPGSNGQTGADGTDATGTLSTTGGLVFGDVAETGASNGTPGYGAPSGGSGTTAGGQQFFGGGGGTGGCPGGGGAGGASGGNSIALLLLSGSVTVQGSQLQTGFGGEGAAGGPGGSGGNGGWGGSPEGLNPEAALYPDTTPCQPFEDPMGALCAAFGGVGGNGGPGGTGGGGAGGWTIGVATIGPASAVLDAASSTTLGQPGNGGLGNGGGHAPNGQRAATFHLN